MPVAARKNTISEGESPISSVKYNEEMDNVYFSLNKAMSFFSGESAPDEPMLNQYWLDTASNPGGSAEIRRERMAMDGDSLRHDCSFESNFRRVLHQLRRGNDGVLGTGPGGNPSPARLSGSILAIRIWFRRILRMR